MTKQTLTKDSLNITHLNELKVGDYFLKDGLLHIVVDIDRSFDLNKIEIWCFEFTNKEFYFWDLMKEDIFVTPISEVEIKYKV